MHLEIRLEDNEDNKVIDWSRVKTIDDVLKLDEHLLFDDAEQMQPADMLKLNPNLTEEEIEDAFFWKDYNRGLMLVTGEPGAGKGILSHMISYKMKHYFGKMAILDTRPRKVFGDYIPFSEEMLSEQVERMSAMERGEGKVDREKWIAHMKKEEKIIDEETGKPTRKVRIVEYDGEVFLRNSVVMMDEFGSKYMPRLQPNLSISQVLLKLFNFWRHMHCLMLGVGVSLEDFNRKALDKAIWEARCVKVTHAIEHRDDPEAIIIGVYLQPIKYNPITDEITKAGNSTPLRINASEPKHVLNGLAWKDIFNTDNAQGFELPSKMRRKQ